LAGLNMTTTATAGSLSLTIQPPASSVLAVTKTVFRA
jgi:hypothetical protein